MGRRPQDCPAEFSLDQFALGFRMQHGYIHTDELGAGIARQSFHGRIHVQNDPRGGIERCLAVLSIIPAQFV
jgi:hypothetical protein